MSVATLEKQQKIRRQASHSLSVYDSTTGWPMGKILDMSARGMKLTSREPLKVRQVYYCRLPLAKKIDGCHEVHFDAECRWCRESEDAKSYCSGYLLRFPTSKDADIVQKLIYGWMAEQADMMNSRYSMPGRNDSP
jgi:hypothetical protein